MNARADWPNFRGPQHDGINREADLDVPKDKPLKLLWEREVGSAFSSYACVRDRAYTCGMKNGKQTLLSLNANTGEVVWEIDIEKAYRNEHGDGTRATPTVNDNRVYILGAHGTLLCVDAKSGEEVWKHEFHQPPTWGYAGSVLIEENMAVVTGGKNESALAAFDKRTGKPIWHCGDDPVGYATPYPFTFNGTRYVVGFTGASAIVAEMKTGRLVLRIPWQTSWKVNAASPIYHNGYLFITSGYRTGCGLFKLAAEGDKLTADEVWQSDVLLNKFQSCVLIDGKLYSSDQKGLKCVDFMTGNEEWNIHRKKHGTLVPADGKFFFLSQEGTLEVGPISPTGFEPFVEAEILSGRCWSIPVIHNGRLYARNLERLVCFDLRGGTND